MIIGFLFLCPLYFLLGRCCALPEKASVTQNAREPQIYTGKENLVHGCQWSFPGMPCMNEDKPPGGGSWFCNRVEFQHIRSHSGVELLGVALVESTCSAKGTGCSCRVLTRAYCLFSSPRHWRMLSCLLLPCAKGRPCPVVF